MGNLVSSGTYKHTQNAQTEREEGGGGGGGGEREETERERPHQGKCC
jgi:hypothetical protein